MTRYYKQTDSMYILAVGVGAGGIEISADEYSEIPVSYTHLTLPTKA